MEDIDFDEDDIEEEMYEFEVTGGGITEANEVIFTFDTEDGRGCIRLTPEEFDGIIADWNELKKKQNPLDTM